MDGSILTSTKKVLGIDEAYTAFDSDIIMHLNSVIATLNQLGVGPANGFMIEDKLPKWSDFLGNDLNLNAVKTYACLRVRMLFDPPTTSYHLQALNEQIRELEWRLNASADKSGLGSTDSNAFWWEVNDYESVPLEAVSGDVAFDPDSGDVWRVV